MAGVVVVVAVVVLGCGATQVGTPANVGGETRRSTDAALDHLGRRPAWLFPSDRCPADAFPGVEKPLSYDRDDCVSNLEQCLERCQSDDANACYLSALRVQEIKAPMEYSEALFLKACSLGVASGCTNRAAGIMVQMRDDSVPWLCVNRTFEAMCRIDDPWACTMWGSSLLYGRGIPADVERARQVLPKGCRLSEDDAACVAARKLLAEASGTSI
jgi:TPR repeat protein